MTSTRMRAWPIAAFVGAVCGILALFTLAPSLTGQEQPGEKIQVQAQVTAKAEVSQEGEVLTRGPVHEAFAEPVELNPTPGLVVERKPPDTIEEAAPDQKPAGENVVWISGYWAWDDEREDFFWISGVWRVVPRDSQWIPGYWVQADKGYQWVGGSWVKVDAELSYLPEPPATQEAGPSSPQPGADHFWIPGSWTWRDGRYVWRAGFWSPAHQGWVWVPARYLWSPNGYLYVAGYWDYEVPRRGLLFAPVYFQRGVYVRPGFVYSPRVVINAAMLAIDLFVRPQYRHYYFGDYYGDTYLRAGYTPWFRYQDTRGNFDPLFTYSRWRYRDDRDWVARITRDYDLRVRDPQARPARTFVEVSRRQRPDSLVIAANLTDFARISASADARISLEAVSRDFREQTRRVSKELESLRSERMRLDARAATAKKGETGKAEPAKFRLPKSPVTAERTPVDADPTKRPAKGEEEDTKQPPKKDDPTKRPPTKGDDDGKQPPKQDDPTKRPPPKADDDDKQPPKKADPPKRDDPTKRPPPPKADDDGKQPPKKADPPRQDDPTKRPPPPPKADDDDKQPPKKADPPKADPPKADPPKKDPPKADPPKADPPKKDPPKVDPPKADPPKKDPPKVDPPKPDPPKVDPPKKDDPPKTPKKPEPKDDEKKEDESLAKGLVPPVAIPEAVSRVKPVPMPEARPKDHPVPLLEARRGVRPRTS